MPKPFTPRYRSVTINLTRDQYTHLQRQAAEQTTSLSQLLRQRLLESPQTEREERHDDAR